MTNEGLKARVEELRTDFQAEKGYPFKHFYCPFLHVDEDVALCKGHVINEKFETSNEWLPQRKDFDNFYGWIAEADYLSVVKNRSTTAFDKWIDPKLNRIFQPQLVSNGEELKYYFTDGNVRVSGQTPVEVVSESGEMLCKLVIKKAPTELMGLNGTSLQVIINRDFRPAVIASVLKAAHLTMFRMLGYNHVFSAGGRWLASILADFYHAYKGKKKNEITDALADYFMPHVCMISPAILSNKAAFAGTIIDNRVMACVGATEGMFAVGILIPAGADAFCVWLPAETGKTIDTYLSFLKEPPPSIAVKLIQYVPRNGDEPPHWTTSREEPFRLQLPDRLPAVKK